MRVGRRIQRSQTRALGHGDGRRELTRGGGGVFSWETLHDGVPGLGKRLKKAGIFILFAPGKSKFLN